MLNRDRNSGQKRAIERLGIEKPRVEGVDERN